MQEWEFPLPFPSSVVGVGKLSAKARVIAKQKRERGSEGEGEGEGDGGEGEMSMLLFLIPMILILILIPARPISRPYSVVACSGREGAGKRVIMVDGGWWMVDMWWWSGVGVYYHSTILWLGRWRFRQDETTFEPSSLLSFIFPHFARFHFTRDTQGRVEYTQYST